MLGGSRWMVGCWSCGWAGPCSGRGQVLNLLCRLWKLVRPGMQISPRMTRVPLNPAIPPPNPAASAAAAVVTGPAMTQQVNADRSVRCGGVFTEVDPDWLTITGAAAFDDVIALAGADVSVDVAAAAAVSAASGFTAQLSQVSVGGV